MASFTCLLPQLLLCIAMVTHVASRSLPRRPESETLQELFGADISSILLTQPDMAEGGGSAQNTTNSWNDGHRLLAPIPGAESPHDVPRLFLDFLNRQRKLRVRSRKSSGRGCFGMKVDRIGALSGMGC